MQGKIHEHKGKINDLRNEFNFSEVHEGMNHSGSLEKFTQRPTAVHTFMNLRKI